jgi:large subunit ribosomal protein L10
MAKAQKIMTRARKHKDLAELQEKLQQAKGVVLTDFTGLTVQDISDLRRRLRDASIDYRVCKNRLIKIAAREANYEDVDPMLTGATAMAFAYDEPSRAAKILVEFAKDNENLLIKGGYIEKKIISVDVVRQLAAIPSRIELLTRLVWGLKSPVASFVYLLKSTSSRLVYALAAIAHQAEQQETK